MSNSRRLALVVAVALLSACAAFTPDPKAQSRCGNPCASVSCPSAFRCDVDSQCTARCQPEQPPRLP